MEELCLDLFQYTLTSVDLALANAGIQLGILELEYYTVDMINIERQLVQSLWSYQIG